MLRDAAGGLWLGVQVDRPVQGGGVMSHAKLNTGATVRVEDLLDGGLVVVRDPPARAPHEIATQLDAYPLEGTLLDQVGGELQD